MGIMGLHRPHLLRSKDQPTILVAPPPCAADNGTPPKGNIEAPPASDPLPKSPTSHLRHSRPHLHLHLPHRSRHLTPSPSRPSVPHSSQSAPVVTSRPDPPSPGAVPPRATRSDPCIRPPTAPTAPVRGTSKRSQAELAGIREASSALVKRTFRDHPPQRHPLADHNRTFAAGRREVAGVDLAVEVGAENLVGVYGRACRILPPPNSPAAAGKAGASGPVTFQLRSGYNAVAPRSRSSMGRVRGCLVVADAPSAGSDVDHLKGLTTVPPPQQKHTYNPHHTADPVIGKPGGKRGAPSAY